MVIKAPANTNVGTVVTVNMTVEGSKCTEHLSAIANSTQDIEQRVFSMYSQVTDVELQRRTKNATQWTDVA